ncbi:MAG: hypothetical protein ACM338_12640 [Betaproteobacteria bacterium]
MPTMFESHITAPMRSARRTRVLPPVIDPCRRPTGAPGVVDGLVSVTLQAWRPRAAGIGADPDPLAAPL